MVQGTASSVGKSLLVTALCRIFHGQGVRVAPFKSWNMALNAAVTDDGLEIGRAQAVQAEAAGIAATADMNPVLLKPEGDARSQVVVLGKSTGSLSVSDYQHRGAELRAIIARSLRRLREAYDLVIIEGAGSPAEINLREHDIANMHVAREADAPVVLVGDIDRGGVFAALVGTLELLAPEERARVGAFVINKFRGDRAILEPGLELLRRRTGIPVLGVIPHLAGLHIADEDAVALDDRAHRRRATTGELDVAVVRLPRIANHDDFAPLEHEPGVVVRFVDDPAALPGADLVILPGSKSTMADLAWLRETGIAEALAVRAEAGHPILGICGGCQMLGERILDPDRVESPAVEAAGLALLPLVTRFRTQKTTARVRAVPLAPWFATAGAASIDGYEIHAGEVEIRDGAAQPACEIRQRNGSAAHVPDGAARGEIVGTMIHGLFENQSVRSAVLARLRERRGLPAPSAGPPPPRGAAYDRLAAVVREHLDWKLLAQLVVIP